AGTQNYFQVRRATGVLEGHDLVIELLPLGSKNVSTGDDHINFLSSSFDGALDFGYALFEWGKTRRKARGYVGDRDSTAFESFDGRFDKQMIDTDRADTDIQFANAEPSDEFVLHRLAGLGAETPHALIGVVTGKRGEIHAGDGAQEPGDLAVLLDGA